MSNLCVVNVAFFLLVGCVGHYQSYDATSIPMLNQSSLEPAGGYLDFVNMLKNADASNITLTRGMCADGNIVVAVMADNLQHLYVFWNDEFIFRAFIEHDEDMAPIHSTLKIVRAEDMSAVTLLADVLQINDVRAG